MNGSNPSASEVRAARREMAICSVLLVGAAAVVFLAGRGTFNSMMLFPHVFAVVVSVVALLTLLTARGVFWRARAALVALVIVFGVAGPVVHQRAFSRSLRLAEQNAMDAIGGKAAPEVSFSEAFGLDTQQSSPMRFGERVTLVNFWATWCGACVGELPALEKFWEEHHEAGIDVVGVTRRYDDGDDPQTAASELDRIERFLEQHGVRYPALVDSEVSPAHRAYRVDSLPSTVLIDRDGVVVAYGAGVSGTARVMDQARELLANPR